MVMLVSSLPHSPRTRKEPDFSNFLKLNDSTTPIIAAVPPWYRDRKSVKLAIFAACVGMFATTELCCGVVFNSLVLLADAVHMVSDVAALMIGLTATRLSQRKSNSTFTYGMGRLETVGAMVNAIALMAIGFLMILEAFGRLLERTLLKEPKTVVVVGCIGLAMNCFGMWILGNECGHSHGWSVLCPPLAKLFRRPRKGQKGYTSMSDVQPPHSHEMHSHCHHQCVAEGESEVCSVAEASNVTVTVMLDDSEGNADIPTSPKATDTVNATTAHWSRAEPGIGHEEARLMAVGACHDGEELHHNHQMNIENHIDKASHGMGVAGDVCMVGCDRDEPKHDCHSKSGTEDDHACDHNHSGSAAHSCGGDENMLAIYLHVLGDVLSSTGVILSGVLNMVVENNRRFLVDPLITLAIACLYITTAAPIVKRTARNLMQAVPQSVDLHALAADLQRLPLDSMNELHVWQLVGNKTVGSVHFSIPPNIDQNEIILRTQSVFKSHGVSQVTVQVIQSSA